MKSNPLMMNSANQQCPSYSLAANYRTLSPSKESLKNGISMHAHTLYQDEGCLSDTMPMEEWNVAGDKKDENDDLFI